MAGDYAPLPFVVFDAQGEATEPDRPWEVWKVCLLDACVAPVGWDARGRPAVPDCIYSVICVCKRTSVGALEQLESRFRTAEAAHAALDLMLADWHDPEQAKHRAVMDRLIVARRAGELAAYQSRLRRPGLPVGPRISLARRRAVPVQLALDDDDVPF